MMIKFSPSHVVPAGACKSYVRTYKGTHTHINTEESRFPAVKLSLTLVVGLLPTKFTVSKSGLVVCSLPVPAEMS